VAELMFIARRGFVVFLVAISVEDLMRLPSKPAWLLIGVHTFCLSIGFWFLGQLLISSAEHQVLQDCWADLFSHSAAVGEVAGTLKANEAASISIDRLQQAATEAAGNAPAAVVLVSKDWTVLNAVATPDSDRWNTGESMKWQLDQTPMSKTEPLRGRIDATGGNCAALAYPTADLESYVVVYDSRSLNSTWRNSVVAALPLAVGIAFLWTWVLSSAATYLLSTRLNSEETRLTAKSEQDALRSAQDLLRTRDAVIFGLAKLAESRDPDTGHHLERISLYSTRLANALRALPEYQSVVTPSFVRLLGISSVLHDIGKVGLEDNVLLKPGRLNAEERSRMQEHTLVAGDCLREIEQRLGASNFLQTAREIALYHHERWDGNGYPMGLSGEEIPLSARIVTVADVYDALSSKRVYKDAFPHDECVRLIREGAGTQFDPDLVRVFLSIEAEFAAIAVRFASAAESRDAENSSIGDVMSRNQEAVLLDVAGNSMLVGDSSRSSSVA
jgi:HD-GYP domain-containing protein (c-di-GMP phosphodiesterase class II)